MLGAAVDRGMLSAVDAWKPGSLLKLMFPSFQASSLYSASLQEQSGYDKKTFMGYIKVSQVSYLTVVKSCSSALRPLLMSYFGRHQCIAQLAGRHHVACFPCSPGWTRC